VSKNPPDLSGGEVNLRDDHVLLRPARADISALDGMLAHLGEETVSIEEMNEAKGDET
jgi:hypothetical protein